MNVRSSLMTGLLMLAAGISACGQTISHLQDSRAPVGAAPRLPTTLPTLEAEAMPMERIGSSTSLDDQLAEIRKALPEFNSVVVRDPGVPADYPMLPAMTLKNVTLGQFLQFIQASYPVVQIIRIDGSAGAL